MNVAYVHVYMCLFFDRELDYYSISDHVDFSDYWSPLSLLPSLSLSEQRYNKDFFLQSKLKFGLIADWKYDNSSSKEMNNRKDKKIL